MGFFGMLAYEEIDDLKKELKNINKRLDTIEKKLKEQEEKTREQRQQEWLDKFGDYYGKVTKNTIPDPCKNCSNHPSNGGSGICHCTVPYMTYSLDGINPNSYNA